MAQPAFGVPATRGARWSVGENALGLGRLYSGRPSIPVATVGAGNVEGTVDQLTMAEPSAERVLDRMKRFED
jgi:hypothetical protein